MSPKKKKATRSPKSRAAKTVEQRLPASSDSTAPATQATPDFKAGKDL